MKDPAINIWMKAIRQQLEAKGGTVRNIRLQAWWDCEKTEDVAWVAILSLQGRQPFVSEAAGTTEEAMEKLGKMAAAWNPESMFGYMTHKPLAPWLRFKAWITGGKVIGYRDCEKEVGYSIAYPDIATAYAYAYWNNSFKIGRMLLADDGTLAGGSEATFVKEWWYT